MRVVKVKGEWGAHQIKCNSKDSKRNHLIAASIDRFNTKMYLENVVDLLVKYPEASIAEIFEMSGPPWPGDEEICLINCGARHHLEASLYSDFSLLTYSTIYAMASTSYPNIFEFIDSEIYQNYTPDHPVHELTNKFRQRFGFEHTMWNGGLNPTTGRERTDAAWIEQKAKRASV